MLKKFIFDIKIPSFSREKKLIMCKKCWTFYYQNSWHLMLPKYFKKNRKKEISVCFTKCGACKREEDILWKSRADLIFDCKTI